MRLDLVMPHQPGAPDTVGGFLRLVAADLLVIGLVVVIGAPLVQWVAA